MRELCQVVQGDKTLHVKKQNNYPAHSDKLYDIITGVHYTPIQCPIHIVQISDEVISLK